MRMNSVRARLTLWNIGVLTIALVTLCVAVRYTVSTYMLNTVDQELARRVRLLPSIEQRPLPPEFRRMMELQHALGSRQRQPARAFRFARVFDTSGHLLGMFGEKTHDDVNPWDRMLYRMSLRGRKGYSTMRVDGEQTRVYSRPLVRDGGIVGVVQAARPLTELTEFLKVLTFSLLVLLPFTLLAAGFGGMFLTDRWIRPVRQITRAAEELSAQDLSRRLEITGNDEFSRLASTFNSMSERLQEAFSRLELSVEEQRRFTADASHELRTPLTTIKANTSLTLRGARSVEEYREALQAVDTAANVMDRLIRDLLLLARSDDGQLLIKQDSVRISDVLDAAVSMAAPSPEQAGVQVEVAEPALAAIGDKHHLVRLVLNLLENALRHTPSAGSVKLTACRENDLAVIRVVDTGEGISPENLPHLGERFYRVDKGRSRSQGGTGLGLAICRSIAQAHGGSISITSALGKGTTVRVELPCQGMSDQ